jgi:hypothetical protein
MDAPNHKRSGECSFPDNNKKPNNNNSNLEPSEKILLLDVSKDPQQVRCICGEHLAVKNTKAGGRTFYACGQKKLVGARWTGGCSVFFWKDEWHKAKICEAHQTASCPCTVHPDIQEALAKGVTCYCVDSETSEAVKARAHITSKDLPYVFFTCGEKRFKGPKGEWLARCPFWIREDEYDERASCGGCGSKITRKLCWKCKTPVL